jgi:hypothetical protein
MKFLIASVTVALGMTICSNTALAESRVVEVWECKLVDGKAIKDVHAVNKKWLAYVNGKVQGGGIESFVMTSIVGNPAAFHFADSYPDMAAWSAAKAAMKSPEGAALDAEFNAVNTCSSNSLHDSESS